MKAEKILSPLTGILLGLTLALGSIGCFASAFDLTLSEPLVFWGSTAGITLLCALVLQWKHGSLAIACLLALLGGFLRLHIEGRCFDHLLPGFFLPDLFLHILFQGTSPFPGISWMKSMTINVIIS